MLISSDVNLHPALVQMRVTLFFDAAIAMLISSEVSFDLQLIFTLPPALRMLIISLVNFINNNFLNSTVVKVVIKNKGRIHFSNNFKIRHFIFIRVCSLTNKCIEMSYDFLGDIDRIGMDAYKQGEEDAKKRAIEILASVLENWVHGGDADCIIAEFEEELMKK